MKIIREKVNVITVEAFCDCGGKLEPCGYVLTCHPPIYPHKCDKCGKGENSDKVYPYKEYQIDNAFSYAMKLMEIESNCAEIPDSCEQVGNSE